MFAFFDDLSLKTKLLVMMLLLSFLSMGLLFFLYARAEMGLISEVKHYTDELSAAIQISMSQLTQDEIKDERLKEYVQRFKQKGVRDISILDNQKEVVASSNPKLIGKAMDIKGDRKVAAGNVQEFITTSEGARNYDILLPVVVGNEQMGYVHIAVKLDDFAELQRENNLKRLAATTLVFVLGIGASLFLSRKYTQPIRTLAETARKVASGDLTQTTPEVRGKDEIGELTRSFNEMVKGLRDMKELEERLRQAEHLSKIGQLSSGIAHEIRNPLNLVNLSIDHIKVTYPPEDPVKRGEFLGILSNIKGEIHRLNDLINNFLDYGKPHQLKIRPASLEDMLDEVLRLAEEKLKEQNIELERKKLENMPLVPMDSQFIKASIMNLVLNAIQAMPTGGRLTVETVTNDGYAIITIRDTGEGIPPENIDRIYEPYFTTKDAGIGLGLAISQKIIDEHSGRIDISSRPGSGTTVIIYLPLVTEAK